MTARQAVLASGVDPSHVSLGECTFGSVDWSVGGGNKRHLNEGELALRREEMARKRRNLSEKKLEDEKAETINRLLKKQSRPKNKRLVTSDSLRPSVRKPKQDVDEDDEDYEELEMEPEEEVPPVMYRWVCSALGTTPIALVSSTEPPVIKGRGSGMCAVEGCTLARKYRLVKDWTTGACGMEHLRVLEGGRGSEGTKLGTL
ncbi:PAPA-1-like conserved region-domain-containing protein [Crucibulum laeve]|uniref:PAPA-1-like conserved region-domain-containing protein n=1 Tax=Crucibulum laeve TaxID=68775 RepID=A0A5C3LPR0_9AGAR|nr:PAPA-1-like conserved region-domain-containing protein [Crucibulum laeve]